MMKKTIIITCIALLSLGFNSCSDNEQLESGKINACKLKHLRERLELDPSNESIQDSVKLFEMYERINRESYAEYGTGSIDKFNEEIAKHLESCE